MDDKRCAHCGHKRDEHYLRVWTDADCVCCALDAFEGPPEYRVYLSEIEEQEITRRVDMALRRLGLNCSFCKPHRGENRKHGQSSKDRKPRYKDHR